MQDLTMIQEVEDTEKQTLSRVYSQVSLIVLMGLFLSFMLFILVLQQSTRSMENDFQHDVSVQVLSLRHKTQVLQQFWDDVQSFYVASEDVTENEFLSFSKMALTHESIVFISWVPVKAVLPTEQNIYLVARKAEEVPEFKKMLMSNERVHNLVSDSERNVGMSATIVSVALEDEMMKDRIMIAVPTFKRSGADKQLIGFMLTMVDISTFFESVFEGDLYGSVAVYLLDNAGAGGAQMLFYQLDDPSTMSYFVDGLSAIETDVEAVHTIPFASKSLAIVAKPSFGFFDAGWAPWTTMGLGLALTSFVAFWFYQQISRNEEITRTVEQKTRALAYSEQRVRSIVDHALDAIITFDENSRILEWNKQAEKIFGWAAEEAVGKDVSDIALAPQYRHIHTRGMRLFLKTGQSKILNKRIETRGIRRDGSIFPMESAVTEQKIGDTFYFTAFIRDVTERREAERTKEHLAAIVLSSDDAIISKDLNGVITSWNKGAEHLYGYSEEEAVGKNITMLIPVDRLKEETEILQAIAQGETIEHFETIRVHKDGTHMDISATISPLRDARGRVVGASKVARDITLRKKVEERLKEYTVDLKRSNKELDDFVYIVSHDLKEPLRGLYSYAQFLQEDYEDKLDEEGQDKLDTIKRLSSRMEELIDTLLYYSRIGRTELAFRPTDLNKTLQKTVELVGPFAEEQNATIHVHDKLPIITCDRARVGEIFRNLIVNGIKYNDNDEKFVEVGCTTDHKECPGCNVFFVSDNGIGIPEKHQEAVFKMFKRLHNREAYGGGTGSGLAFVKKILDRHGGKIWIDSKDGEGTTFYFTLEEV